MKIAVLTNSSSGLKNETYSNLFVLSLPIILENNSVITDEINNDEIETNILKKIENSKIKTSFINPFIWETKIIEILENYDHIIFLPTAYNLSSEYENSLILLKNDNLKSKLTIVKHYFTGIQLGKFIISLINKIKNITNISQINVFEFVNDWAKKSLLIVIPGNLNNLSNSGRVKKIIYNLIENHHLKVGIFWQIKPKKIISKNYENLIKKYIKYVTKKFKLDQSEIYIAHTKLCQKEILKLLENELLPLTSINWSTLPTIFAVHGGIDTIGIVVFKK